MKRKKYILVAVICVMSLAFRSNAETAGELIAQAHKHDNMYTLGPEASQQKALSFYESALAAEPDEKQRLHILYRMAQLCGSSYDLSKGEKPDFHKANRTFWTIVSRSGSIASISLFQLYNTSISSSLISIENSSL